MGELFTVYLEDWEGYEEEKPGFNTEEEARDYANKAMDSNGFRRALITKARDEFGEEEIIWSSDEPTVTEDIDEFEEKEIIDKPYNDGLALGDPVVIRDLAENSPWEGLTGYVVWIDEEDFGDDFQTITVRVNFPTENGVKEINQNFDRRNVFKTNNGEEETTVETEIENESLDESSDEKLELDEGWLVVDPYDDEETKVAKEAAKKCKLSKVDYEQLLDDIYNLRGNEWLDEIKKSKDDNLIKRFKVVAQIEEELEESLEEAKDEEEDKEIEKVEETEVVNDEKIDEIKDEIKPTDVIPAEEQAALATGKVIYDEEGNVIGDANGEFEKTPEPGELKGDADFAETEVETEVEEPAPVEEPEAEESPVEETPAEEPQVEEQPAEEEHSLEIPVETYTEVEDIKRINGELSQKIKENKIFAIRKERDEETGEDTLMFAEPGINGIWLVVLRDGKYIKKIVLF